MDPNGAITEAKIKNLTKMYFMYNTADLIRRANQHMIKVNVIYQSSKVDMTVLDSRYTLSDKIGNFGGTFGIWVELTGFPLLGIINMCLLVLKMLCKMIRYPKK